ncbi:hypothetical protein LMG18101_04105 [Ralstonia flaminis]|uniref:Uncharacterized protein n=1 Tax=Ralstonia flaminis TaxID=3058597 RepID=A0ABM9K8P3_9RALS|nr:hypothetical protein LMG18101_04105 [Ralstonia sp. LMG 18101]
MPISIVLIPASSLLNLPDPIPIGRISGGYMSDEFTFVVIRNLVTNAARARATSSELPIESFSQSVMKTWKPAGNARRVSTRHCSSFAIPAASGRVALGSNVTSIFMKGGWHAFAEKLSTRKSAKSSFFMVSMRVAYRSNWEYLLRSKQCCQSCSDKIHLGPWLEREKASSRRSGPQHSSLLESAKPHG